MLKRCDTSGIKWKRSGTWSSLGDNAITEEPNIYSGLSNVITFNDEKNMEEKNII